MVKLLAATLASAVSLMVLQPGQAAPVADTRSQVMAARLFPAVEAIVEKSLPADAREMLAGRRVRILGCKQDMHCIVRNALWTDSERLLLAGAAARSLSGKSAVDMPDDGAGAQVVRELNGLNSILQVYGLGLAPRNAEIDGPIYRPGTPAFSTRVSDAVALNDADGAAISAIDPSVGLAISLLDVNDRYEAAAFEPLDKGYNAAAIARSRKVDWSKFKYTAIIVPGNGPDLVGESLSPRGKLRVKLAAALFNERVAPYILVSGGAVHPRGTKISEASAMRDELINQYGIPADSVILEPYARYTSTNLRNAARRLRQVNAPFDHDALIVTDADHSLYIESDAFRTRSLLELGYETGKVGPRTSSTTLMYRPYATSFRIDPADPLDP